MIIFNIAPTGNQCGVESPGSKAVGLLLVLADGVYSGFSVRDFGLRICCILFFGLRFRV